MSKYKDQIRESMEFLAKDKKTVFIGYNVKYGGRAAGSLVNVDEVKLIETPINENLMLSMGIGMSMDGWMPVIFYERFDFIMNAMDALVNHLDKIEKISNGEFSPKVIIRVVIGGSEKPFFTGETHTQDFTETMKRLLEMVDVIRLESSDDIEQIYKDAYYSNRSSMIIERKDLY